MKRVIFIMVAMLLLSGLVRPTVSEAKFESYGSAIKFADVLPNSSHYGNITRLAEKKIIMGTSTNRAGEMLFLPNDKVTNRQVAIMLGRALNLDMKKTGKHRFADIPSKDTAFNTIHALTEMGVYDKTKNFNPANYVTRQEIAKTLSKAFKLTAQSNIVFSDVKKTNPYYPYIQSLAKAKITVADAKGNFNPKKVVTRAQFATFLQRALDLKQYLNQTTPGLISQSEKLSLASGINEHREIFYDINPFVDPNEIAHFLYLRANDLYGGEDYRDPIDGGDYSKISKQEMDNYLQKTYGFTIKNPEKLKHSLIDYVPISYKPVFYEKGWYYYLKSYTGNWGGRHRIVVDNAIKVKKNIYYGLAYDFEIDDIYRDFNIDLPFTKWPESRLNELNLANYYYFVALDNGGPSYSIDKFTVVYRDREGFKTKAELEKFVSQFTKFK